jgi:hypothetical protein
MRKSRFFGGAYDGLELDHEQINAYCEIWSQPVEGDERRKFVLVPPPDKWDDLVAGRIGKDKKAEWGTTWMYEMKRTQSGVEWHLVRDTL